MFIFNKVLGGFIRMLGKKFYVIIELDNVLYDFANYYLNIVDFIGSFVNENFGINKEAFLNSFIYRVRNSVFPNSDYLSTTYEVLREYDSKILAFENNSARVSFINSLRMKFNQARIKYLKFFQGAISFLKEVKESGGIIIGFTNSPSRSLKQRLKLLEIDKYFESVYCTQDNISSIESELENQDVEKINSIPNIWFQSICNNVSSLMCDVIEFPEIYRKPSKRGLQRILEDEEIPEKNVLVIGNSIESDIFPAKLLKLNSVLINAKIKISNKNILHKFLKFVPKKNMRKILNLPNNKSLLAKIDSIKVMSSIPEFMYSLIETKTI